MFIAATDSPRLQNELRSPRPDAVKLGKLFTARLYAARDTPSYQVTSAVTAVRTSGGRTARVKVS